MISPGLICRNVCNPSTFRPTADCPTRSLKRLVETGTPTRLFPLPTDNDDNSSRNAAEQEKYAYDTQPNYLHGVPSHDFTAAPPTGGIASSNYGAVADYDPYGYPPGGQGQQHDYSAHADETVGGNGYADLRRGPSTVGTNFAGMGAGPGGLQSAAPPVPPMPQHYGGAQDMGYEREETLYSDNPNNLGRPTQGEGPYFAASQAGQGQRY
jgi:hypothetical protein